MTKQAKSHLLYIDATHHNDTALSKLVAEHGWQLSHAPSSGIARGLMASQQFDALLMVHQVPEVDVVSWLALEESPPVVIMVAADQPDIAAQALEAGAAHYLLRDESGHYLKLLPTVLNQAQSRQKSEETLQQAQAVAGRYSHNLSQLNRAGQTFSSIHELERVIERLLSALVNIVDADGSSVWLWDDEDPNELVCRAVYHQDSPPALLDLRLAKGEGVAGWVAMHGQPSIVRRTSEDSRFASDIDQQSGFSTISLMAVPIRLQNRILGVLEAVNKHDGEFGDEDLSYAETLAAWSAIAIENARLVSQLRVRSDDLLSRNYELDTFGHTVAHDLKNPLGLVTGYAELLGSKWPSLSDDERARCLDGILTSTNKMERIIEELLVMKGLRDQEVTAVPIDMANVLKEAHAHLDHLLAQYEATLILPDSWPVALGHAPWVEQVWVNYISNALKYGGRPPRVEVGATELDRHIRFWVRDNGPGLSESERNKLFEPFTQLHKGKRERGHGLGLSIVRQIMEKLGGEVSVASEPGQGSVFSFTLPTAHTGDLPARLR